MLRLRRAGTGILCSVADGRPGEARAGHERGERPRRTGRDVGAPGRSSAEGLRRRPVGLGTECPGWSVQDQLSHLIGIERTLLGEPRRNGTNLRVTTCRQSDRLLKNGGSLPVEPSPERSSGPSSSRSPAPAGRAERPDRRGVGPRRWPRIGEVAYARVHEVRVFDSWVHEQDVRLALGRPGGSGGLASSTGPGQVQAAMGFIVGKKAAAPGRARSCDSR